LFASSIYINLFLFSVVFFLCIEKYIYIHVWRIFTIVVEMKGDLERIMEKLVEKYKFNGVKEPLLSEQNVVYMLWRIKGLIWNSMEKDVKEENDCDLPLYIDRLFDEISSLSDAWLSYLTSFNSQCLQYINNKKVLEMLVDLLILRNIYYELRKSS